MGRRSCASGWATTTSARAARDSTFKRCCRNSGRYDGAPRSHYFQSMSLLVLFGGPAGAGKSTLAAAWCATRQRAVHIELDEVRHLIVAGRADPQQPGELAAEQYDLAVAGCLAL